MSLQSNLMEMSKSLMKLQESGKYDVEKYSYALLHQTSQLEYFYCQLVKDGDCDQTYYHVNRRPKVHELAYFNIGRGFPKELMDGHWCYILKDMGYKMLVIPCTSIKKDSSEANPLFEKDIQINTDKTITKCRIQLSDIRSVDIQRLDLRKPIYSVLSDFDDIKQFVRENLFDIR